MSQFLRDDVLGFGLSQIEARRQARTLLTLGEQALGLLVERDQPASRNSFAAENGFDP